MIIEEKDVKVGELPVNKIIHGDALTVLKKLPSNSIDCVITSPPYWSKRDYGEETCRVWGGDPNCEHEWTEETHQSHGMFCRKCGAWYGQLGLEPDPFMFVDHLIEIFREVKRVLKLHGNVFVVIDDSYIGSHQGYGSKKKSETGFQWVGDGYYAASKQKPPTTLFKGAPRKSMALVPELFAIRMVYDLGFILRNKIIWPKKVLIYKDMETIGNAIPESVRDRMTHTWEYIYHFVKEPKYYYDQLRIPYKESTIVRNQYGWSKEGKWGDRSKHNPYAIKVLQIHNNSNSIQLTLDRQISQENNNPQRKYENTADFTFADNLAKIREAMRELGLPECHPLGANAPDVIQINTEPFPEAHFAVFPTKLVELLIKVGCPEQICRKCGKPRERIVEKNYVPTRPGKNVLTGKSGSDLDPNKALHTSELSTKRMMVEYYTVGWTDCGCGAGWKSGIVLDPFLGSGTTALVALKMGRRFIGIELNREYCEIALRRIKPYLAQKTLETFS